MLSSLYINDLISGKKHKVRKHWLYKDFVLRILTATLSRLCIPKLLPNASLWSWRFPLSSFVSVNIINRPLSIQFLI